MCARMCACVNLYISNANKGNICLILKLDYLLTTLEGYHICLILKAEYLPTTLTKGIIYASLSNLEYLSTTLTWVSYMPHSQTS